MIALQEPQSYRVRVLITRTILALVLVNQFAFLSHWTTGGNTIAETINQSLARSFLQDKYTSLAPATINQPIIFVHGLFQDARLMGIPQKNPAENAFVPLYRELNRYYGSVQTFWYLDDVGYSDGIDKTSHCPQQYGVCLSQSSIIDNAAHLDQMITSLYTSSHHKVTLIGYSMGAAIIRTALTGCPQTVTCQANLNANIAELVNDVFFIAGVQQGSWVAKEVVSAQEGIDAGVSLLANYQPALQAKWRLTKKAAAELAPQSANVLLHNSSDPPHHIHYFNFYGDIQFSLENCFAVFCITGKSTPIGDGILLPGSDDPKATPLDGGARFCLQCNGNNFSQIDADTTYTQWPLRGEVSIDYSGLENCNDLGCVLAELSPLFNAPQMHTYLPSDAALDGTDIQVVDTTGISGSKTTSIAHEIALQLQAMPPTQTNCPSIGTARAAVMVPLALGTHQNIVYIYNEGSEQAPTFGNLKRYDVTTGQKTQIVALANTSISEAQLSPDGQWILFVSQVSGQAAIQMVRMDGQGLQTLHCAPSNQSISGLSWSPDQASLVFNEGINLNTSASSESPLSTYLLTIASGALQRILIQPRIISQYAFVYYIPSYWIDNSRLYMLEYTESGRDNPLTGLDLLDTTKGTNQQGSDLLPITKFSGSLFQSFALSPDRTTFFLTQCSCAFQDGTGPSSITVKPAGGGGTPKTIYTNPTAAITGVYPITNTSLLLLMENYANAADVSIDTSQNGVWEVNTDGTGLTRLTTESPAQNSEHTILNTGSPSPWANVSRDGTMFAVGTVSYDNNSSIPYTATLIYGSLSGNTPIQNFVSAPATNLFTTPVTIIGWTTL